MSIDLCAVTSEEFALADAVTWMTAQYAYRAGPTSQHTSLTTKAYEALLYYDYIVVHGEKYHWNEPQVSIAIKLSEREGFLRNQKYWGNVSIDAKYLNARSRHLLTILAKLASEFLDLGGSLWHEHMSAGQAAWGELLTYRLIYEDEHGGHWTAAGLDVLKSFDDLGSFPV